MYKTCVKRCGVTRIVVGVLVGLLVGCDNQSVTPASENQPQESSVAEPQSTKSAESAEIAENAAKANSGSAEIEELLLTTPHRWRVAASVVFKDFRRAVFIPPPEAADADQTDTMPRDQELLIIEGFAIDGATKEQTDPLAFSAALAKHEQEICKTFADQSTYAGIERGFPSAVRLFLCTGRGTGGNRLTLVKTMRGEHMFYLVARQLRTEKDIGEDNPKAAAERLAAWSLHLRGVGMCSIERTDDGQCATAAATNPND